MSKTRNAAPAPEPDNIAKAIAGVQAKEAPHPRFRLELALPSGHGALIDVPAQLGPMDVAILFLSLADIVTGRAAEQQTAPKGVIATPTGPHLVR